VGALLFRKRKLTIKALPADLPDFFTVDISKLKIAGTITVATLLNDKITFLHPDSTAIIQVKASRNVLTGDEEEEGGEEGATEAATDEATAAE